MPGRFSEVIFFFLNNVFIYFILFLLERDTQEEEGSVCGGAGGVDNLEGRVSELGWQWGGQR